MTPRREPEIHPPRRRGGPDPSQIAVFTWGAHLVGIVTSGLGNIVALILAYVKRDDLTGTIYRDHLDRAIRVFWIAVPIWVIGWLCMVTIVLSPLGLAVFFGLAIFLLVTGIKGLMRALDGRPYTG